MPTYTINGKRVTTEVELSDEQIDEIAGELGGALPAPPRMGAGSLRSKNELLKRISPTRTLMDVNAKAGPTISPEVDSVAKDVHETLAGAGGRNKELQEHLLDRAPRAALATAFPPYALKMALDDVKGIPGALSELGSLGKKTLEGDPSSGGALFHDALLALTGGKTPVGKMIGEASAAPVKAGVQGAKNLAGSRAGKTALAVAGEVPLVGTGAKRMVQAGKRAWEKGAPPPQELPPPPTQQVPPGPRTVGPSPDLPPIDIELPPPPQVRPSAAGPQNSPTGPTSGPPQPAGGPIDIPIPPAPSRMSRPAGPTTSSPGGPPIDLPVNLPRPPTSRPAGPPSGPTGGPTGVSSMSGEGPIDIPLGPKTSTPFDTKGAIQRLQAKHPDWSPDELLAAVAEERMAPTNKFNEPGKLRAGDRWGWRSGETSMTPEGEVFEPRKLPTKPPELPKLEYKIPTPEEIAAQTRDLELIQKMLESQNPGWAQGVHGPGLPFDPKFLRTE